MVRTGPAHLERRYTTPPPQAPGGRRSIYATGPAPARSGTVCLPVYALISYLVISIIYNLFAFETIFAFAFECNRKPGRQTESVRHADILLRYRNKAYSRVGNAAFIAYLLIAIAAKRYKWVCPAPFFSTLCLARHLHPTACLGCGLVTIYDWTVSSATAVVTSSTQRNAVNVFITNGPLMRVAACCQTNYNCDFLFVCLMLLS